MQLSTTVSSQSTFIIVDIAYLLKYGQTGAVGNVRHSLDHGRCACRVPNQVDTCARMVQHQRF
jgi:hypothetical protein